MQILLNQKEWVDLKSQLPGRYNISFNNVRGNPEKFPCGLFTAPVLDQNGYAVSCTFVYCEQAEELLKARLRSLKS